MILHIFAVEFKCPGGGESIDQEVVYFQNAEFPQGSTLPTMCIFSISVKDSTICQIRFILLSKSNPIKAELLHFII